MDDACFLNIDKPAGMTSRDVVNRVSRTTKVRRAGHAGTLDPLATGVLVVAIGVATRLVEYVQGTTKIYDAQVRLGCTSNTDDREGEIVERCGVIPTAQTEIEAVLPEFVGDILQQPPAYSALKVNGRRAYELARKGDVVTLEPRVVSVYSIEVLHYEYPRLDLRIVCGAGTYIRSMARDLGERLGVGGMLDELRRTAVGCFTTASAIALDDLSADNWREFAQPLSAGLGSLPKLVVGADDRRRFLLGQLIHHLNEAPSDGEAAVLDEQGSLLGIGLVCRENQTLQPKKGGFVGSV